MNGKLDISANRQGPSEENRKNLIVYRSSAGSGKTFTLVLNYLAIVLTSENKFNFKEILAITFTNKAAAEMKSRVFEHLIELAEPTNDSNISIAYQNVTGLSGRELSQRASESLSIMLHNYSEVAIMTIDRFAHRLIRSFSRDLNLESDFEIEMDFGKILREAIDSLIDQVGQREDLTRLLVHHARDRAKSDQSWKATGILNEFGYLLSKEDTSSWLEPIQDLTVEDVFEAHQKASSSVFSLIKGLEKTGEEFCHLLENQSIIDWVPRGWGGWAGFFRIAASGDYNKLLKEERKSLTKAMETGVWLKKGAPESAINAVGKVAEDIEQKREEILELCKEIQKNQIVREQIVAIGLLKEINSLIDQYKKDNNLVLISDFNRTISEIVLEQPTPFIYERIGCRFKHYFIDEFQDTSVRQWQNFIPLLDDSLSQGNTNLLVGDAKQAIYRFRNGEARQFVMLPEIFNKNESEVLHNAERVFRQQIQQRQLTFNYRSTPTVVNFNNDLFSFIKQSLPPVLAENYQSHEQIPIKTNPGLVKMYLHNLKRNEVEERTRFQNDKTLFAIKECLQDGFRMEDITILVRKNNHGEQLADFLIEQGIPVTSPDSLRLLSNAKVKFVLSLLKILENAHTQEDSLRAISFLYPASTTDKALLLNLRKSEDEGKQALLNLLKHERQVDLLSWQSKTLYLKSASIIHHFLTADVIDQFVESFLENVHQFGSSKGEDINQFLEWITELNPSISASEHENAVRIMTIHKSKGLEFPVAIVHRCDWNLKPGNQSRVWSTIKGEETNLSVRLRPAKDVFTALNKEDELEEAWQTEYLDALNLMYVALTRPVERLYIVSSQIVEDTVSELLYGFLTTSESLETPIEWSVGERTDKASTSEDSGPIGYSYTCHTQFPIDIVTRHKSEETNMHEQRWGQLVHLALERTSGVQDIESVIDKLIKDGKITGTERNRLSEDLKKTLNHPKLQSWISEDHENLTEKEIVDEAGNLYRPDRIILMPEETIVLDFKTGQPRNHDEQQITTYGHLLQDLGYHNIKKYLFYVRKSELKEILTL